MELSDALWKGLRVRKVSHVFIGPHVFIVWIKDEDEVEEN